LLNLLLFLIDNFCLLFFAIVVTYNIQESGICLRIIKVSVIFITEVLGLVLIAGLVLQRLNLAVLTIMCILILIAAVIISTFKKPKYLLNFRYIKFDIRTLFKRENLYITIPFIFIAMTLVIKLLANLLVINCSYDSEAYHLPGLVDYIQSGKIYLSDKWIWSNAYPRTIEMLNLWMLIFMRSGILTDMPQYLISLLGASAMYGIIKDSGVRRKLAFLGGLLYISTPIILAQMTTAYVDTCLASILICCVYFMIRYFKNYQKSNIVFISILSGILIGIKFSSVGYFAVLVLTFLTMMLLSKHKITSMVRALGIIFAGCFSVGGVWYVLNIINYKNPLYPVKVSFLGKTIFDGINLDTVLTGGNVPTLIVHMNKALQVLVSWIGIDPGSSNLSMLYRIGANFFTIYDQRIGGFGFQWILIFVPGIFLLAFKRIKTKNFVKAELIILLISVLSFIITPCNWWSRYTCFIIALGIYSFIVLLYESRRIKPFNILLSAFVILSCYQGIGFDLWGIFATVDSYKDHTDYSIRSTYVQFYKKDFRMDIREAFKEINKDKNGCDIDCFGVNSSLYLFCGDNTQNRVKDFLYLKDKYAPNYNVDTYDSFSKVLTLNPADFVVITPYYKDMMARYINEKKEYEMLCGKEDITVYRVIGNNNGH
jgi:hypothetical protein